MFFARLDVELDEFLLVSTQEYHIRGQDGAVRAVDVFEKRRSKIVEVELIALKNEILMNLREIKPQRAIPLEPGQTVANSHQDHVLYGLYVPSRRSSCIERRILVHRLPKITEDASLKAIHIKGKED